MAISEARIDALAAQLEELGGVDAFVELTLGENPEEGGPPVVAAGVAARAALVKAWPFIKEGLVFLGSMIVAKVVASDDTEAGVGVKVAAAARKTGWRDSTAEMLGALAKVATRESKHAAAELLSRSDYGGDFGGEFKRVLFRHGGRVLNDQETFKILGQSGLDIANGVYDFAVERWGGVAGGVSATVADSRGDVIATLTGLPGPDGDPVWSVVREEDS